MACLDRETATAYLRGDFDPDEAERWAAHLAVCEACRGVVEEVSALIEDVRHDLMTLDASSHAAWSSPDRLIARHDRDRPSAPPASAWWRPTTIGVTLASLVMIAIVLWMRGTPVSAAEILARASTAERTTNQQAGLVLFRVVTVEERRGRTRTLVSRRRVETWRQTGTTLTARRAYNETGHLVAAEWIDSAGARTLYATGQAPAKRDEAPLTSRELLRTRQLWRLELSATSFSSLIESPAAAHATETADAVRISYESALSDLTAATLTLSTSDLHAVEQTLSLGRGDDVYEFRIAEDRVTRVAPESVDASVFDVDANLARGSSPAARLAAPPRRPSESMVMGLEIEALRLLDGAGALLGEQVSVARTPAGIVRVEATVDSRARKDEIERALAPLARHEGVRVDIETFEAAAAARDRERRPSGQSRVVRAVEIERDDIAVGPTLRRYFRSSPSAESESDAEIDRRVRTFASQAVEHSRLIVRHAWAMKNLARRYSPEARLALDEDARAAWLTLIRRHASAIADRGDRLRQLLHPVFFAGEPLAVPASDVPVEDVSVASERILTLAQTQDDAVRNALVASGTPAATIAFLQTPSFWNSLTELVTLAGRAAAE